MENQDFCNYKFDLETWTSDFLFPRAVLEFEDEVFGRNSICGPTDICVNEALRKLMGEGFIDWGASVPVDIFIWSLGEPVNRFATKSGGLPYRSIDLPWPSTHLGSPMSLLGQINFSDSKDIVGRLPGDLLLIFGDFRDNEGSYEFFLEWQTFGLTNLVEKVPAGVFFVEPCYGSILRRNAFPNAKLIDEYQEPLTIEGKRIRFWQELLEYPATQIGNAPPFIQMDDENQFPGKPLCRVSTINPLLSSSLGFPFPFINVADGSVYDSISNSYLTIGDLGAIDVFIDENGQVVAGESCF